MISHVFLILGVALLGAAEDPRCARDDYSTWRCGDDSFQERRCVDVGCCWRNNRCHFKSKLIDQCNDNGDITQRTYCGSQSPASCEALGCCFDPSANFLWCYRTKETDRGGECVFSGDPHYTTYDGSKFDFMGECTYIVSETKSLDRTNPRWFSVQVKNVGDGRVSWAKIVTILFNGGKNKVVLLEDGAQVNGEDAYEANTDTFTVRASGISRTFTALETGLTVKFGPGWALGYTVSIEIPASYRNQVHGLCGNFDGDASNDMTTKAGTLLSNVNEFAMSYEIGFCGTTPPPPPTCEDRAKWSSNEYCGSMTDRNGVFAECVDLISSQDYLDNCVTDLCAVDDTRSKEILSGALEVYLKECGAKICDWKKVLDLPRISCPENSEYSGCASGCPDTCMFPDASKSCDTTPSEGCMCNEGYLSDAGTCIPREQCGCNVDGLYHPIGEKERKLATRENCVCSESQQYTCECLKGFQRQGDVCNSITTPWQIATNHLFYKVFQQYSDYKTARATCIENGAILASRGIRDLNVREQVLGLMDEFAPTWIGVNDINEEGKWVWEDGIVSDNDIQWGHGQPDNSNNDNDCAFYVGGSVINRPCSRKMWFLCEREY